MSNQKIHLSIKKEHNHIHHCLIIIDKLQLIIYTNNIVTSYDIVFSGTVEELAQALDEGLVLLTSKEGNKVFVVTSDYAEQIVILGVGAYRISAREFNEEYLAVKKQINERNSREVKGKARNEVGNRLKDDVLVKLERLRR